MLQLHTRTDTRWDEEPLVLRVSIDGNRPISGRSQEAFLIPPDASEVPADFRAYLAIENAARSQDWRSKSRCFQLPTSMSYLGEGDIVRLSPRSGHVSVLYRRESWSNSMLLTERCNSNCIMCSQPPKEHDDSYLVDAYLQAIPLMAHSTQELGITGGEPTLLGLRLLELITACKVHLPETALHLLSNGRLFNYLSLCEKFARIDHPNLMVGIPLYSDIAWRHDYVVQARGAFDQTIRGIMNLERCGLRVEVRVVLHRQTIQRLPDLARFLARNLPFVEHVALMGLEMMGYVRMNLAALWIDPVEYQAPLAEAVRILRRHQMTVSIYNHQLCTLDEELWPFARKSISDWKNEYVSECEQCSVRSDCGGFFSSAGVRHSDHIRPILRKSVDEQSIAPIAFHSNS